MANGLYYRSILSHVLLFFSPRRNWYVPQSSFLKGLISSCASQLTSKLLLLSDSAIVKPSLIQKSFEKILHLFLMISIDLNIGKSKRLIACLTIPVKQLSRLNTTVTKSCYAACSSSILFLLQSILYVKTLYPKSVKIFESYFLMKCRPVSISVNNSATSGQNMRKIINGFQRNFLKP